MKGLQPVSLNSYISGLNSFLRWANREGHLPELVTIPKIKCETKIISTFTPEQVRRLLAYRPKSESNRRVYALACLLLDTGMRISEASGLLKGDFDFDNLLAKVRGKGGKHRLVPMSLELRKILYRYLQRQPFHFAFATRNGTRPTRRNLTRDLYCLCRKVGLPPKGFHTLRHTFAVNYLRNGGSVFHLQKILGHSTLEMSRRYCNLLTEDLQAVHNNLTLLSR
jgi:integrase/recombinase XerD